MFIIYFILCSSVTLNHLCLRS